MPTDVVIVGAGVAGLAAAAALRDAGLATLVVEATPRIGGRAWTERIGAAPFDRGASWLHMAERNPLADRARAEGETIRRSEDGRTRIVMTDGRRASDAEQAEFDAAWDSFETLASARAAEEPDVSVFDAIAPLRNNPWTATVEFWEASLIAAADSRRLSVKDWHLNLLEGTNLSVSGGIGAFVARRLGPQAGEVLAGTPVSRIEWQAPGGVVRVVTPRGIIEARACIVTVSTGVLAAGAIAFAPALPEATQTAIAGLPMGLLTKVALRATGADRLDLASHTSVQTRLPHPGAPAMSFNCWPGGADHIVGFVGGAQAWELSREGEAATADFARERLRALFGARADAALRPEAVADWAIDPAYRGAYAYALPGHAGARAMLGTPLAEGRLVFAGEAVRTDGLAGTVGGAYLSGQDAARGVIEMIGAAVA